MKMTLISPYTSITMHNVRQLSACMKKAGHEVDLVWLPAYPKTDVHLKLKAEPYEEVCMENLRKLCKDSDLVGISLMTEFYSAARQITQSLKGHVKAPILWGGFHPSFAQEQCIQSADIVCTGEADEALLELADYIQKGQDYVGLSGFWFKKSNGEVVKGASRPWFKDLGSLPLPDSDTRSHWCLTPDGNEIVRMSDELKEYHMPLDAASNGSALFYPTSTTRGCPYSCTFCGNNSYRESGGNAGYVRKYPMDWIVADIKQGIKVYNPDMVLFNDECFTCKGSSHIKEFADAYKKEVGLPFRALSTPSSVKPEYIAQLVDAGMICLQVGVQSGSLKTLKEYRREWSGPDSVIEASRILAQYYPRLTAVYDIILDNPYETPDDVKQTAWLIQKMSKPARFQLFSMTAYPGTQLAQRMIDDGYVDPETMQRKGYQDKLPVYGNILCSLASKGVPTGVFRPLASKAAFNMLDHRWLSWAYSSIYNSSFAVQKWAKKARARERSGYRQPAALQAS